METGTRGTGEWANKRALESTTGLLMVADTLDSGRTLTLTESVLGKTKKSNILVAGSTVNDTAKPKSPTKRLGWCSSLDVMNMANR